MLKKLCESSGDKLTLYYLLHMLGNYLQIMIEKRVTTELVTGFESQIGDIK